MHIDLEVELDMINDNFMKALESFAPFGPQNMRPVFLTRNCEVVGNAYVVGRNHLKMKVRKGDSVFDVIGYGLGDKAREITSDSCLIDIVYCVEYNTWNDVTRIQINLKDVKLTVGSMPYANN